MNPTYFIKSISIFGYLEGKLLLNSKTTFSTNLVNAIIWDSNTWKSLFLLFLFIGSFPFSSISLNNFIKTYFTLTKEKESNFDNVRVEVRFLLNWEESLLITEISVEWVKYIWNNCEYGKKVWENLSKTEILMDEFSNLFHFYDSLFSLATLPKEIKAKNIVKLQLKDLFFSFRFLNKYNYGNIFLPRNIYGNISITATHRTFFPIYLYLLLPWVSYVLSNLYGNLEKKEKVKTLDKSKDNLNRIISNYLSKKREEKEIKKRQEASLFTEEEIYKNEVKSIVQIQIEVDAIIDKLSILEINLLKIEQYLAFTGSKINLTVYQKGYWLDRKNELKSLIDRYSNELREKKNSIEKLKRDNNKSLLKTGFYSGVLDFVDKEVVTEWLVSSLWEEIGINIDCWITYIEWEINQDVAKLWALLSQDNPDFQKFKDFYNDEIKNVGLGVLEKELQAEKFSIEKDLIGPKLNVDNGLNIFVNLIMIKYLYLCLKKNTRFFLPPLVIDNTFADLNSWDGIYKKAIFNYLKWFIQEGIQVIITIWDDYKDLKSEIEWCILKISPLFEQ